jgi:hypothetical protein
LCGLLNKKLQSHCYWQNGGRYQVKQKLKTKQEKTEPKMPSGLPDCGGAELKGWVCWFCRELFVSHPAAKKAEVVP